MKVLSRVEAPNMRSSTHTSSFFLFGVMLMMETNMLLYTTATTSFSEVHCNDMDNATDPTTFLANFNATYVNLRATLSSPAAAGFATFQLVRSSVPIYAIFHCRGYTSRLDCLACLDTVFTLLADHCLPKYRATVFTDGCYLRYAMINVFYTVTSPGQSGFCDKSTAAERQVGFNETASEALAEVERAVMGREGRFVAGRKGASGGGVVYATGECLPVLGTADCRSCLESALRNVRGCLPEAGGRAVESGCFMRFSGEEFFNGSLAIDLDLIGDGGGGE